MSGEDLRGKVAMQRCVGDRAVDFEAYFDESATGGALTANCISGYMFEAGAAARMKAEWLKALAAFDLPYFHMVECVHRRKNFQRYHDANDVETPRIIMGVFVNLIMRYAYKGISMIYNPIAFSGIHTETKESLAAKLYADAAFVAGSFTQSKCGHATNEPGTLRFVFEQGHVGQKILKRTLENLFFSDQARDVPRVTEIKFATKMEEPLTQAADILAWSSTKYAISRAQGYQVRPEFEALLASVDHLIHHLRSERSDYPRGAIGTMVYEDYPLVANAKMQNAIEQSYKHGRMLTTRRFPPARETYLKFDM